MPSSYEQGFQEVDVDATLSSSLPLSAKPNSSSSGRESA